MNKEILLEKLQNRASFSFTKKDGTVRDVEAATTNIDLIPADQRPTNKKDQNKKKENNPDLISFFDFGVNAWRSCQFNQIISIND